MSDPDREELVPVCGLQKHDRLLADQVEADPIDEHLVQRDLEPNIAQAAGQNSAAILESGRNRHRYPGVERVMLTPWLQDLESLEAISQNDDARKIFLKMAAMSHAGRLPNFLAEVAHDQELDDTTKDHLTELANDQAFLLAVEEYLRRTQLVH
jgi:hypothetical protein